MPPPSTADPAPGLLEKAADAGLRSLFVGFETLSEDNLASAGKTQNLSGRSRDGTRRGLRRAARLREYDAAVKRLHDLGVMVNGAFVFGMDDDDATSSRAPWSGR